LLLSLLSSERRCADSISSLHAGDDEEVYEEELEQMRSAERKAEAAAVASSAASTPRLGSTVT
jgi:hypothetical protein